MKNLSNQFPWQTVFPVGTVFLVGAGPGDPELITMRGAHLLAQADIIFHDHLGCEELIAAARPGAELVDVAKHPGKHTITQDEINHRMLTAARENKRVVRLKGGDPFVFGRGGEEAKFLADHGVRCEVVPGITSAIAAPGAAGIPVTHRGTARTFAVATTKGGDGSVPPIVHADTRIWLMGVSELPAIVGQMISDGVDPETPSALIADATTYRQRVVTGELRLMEALAQEHGIAPPAVLVVGDTARFARADTGARKVIVVTSTRIPSLLRKKESDAIFLWRSFFDAVPLDGEQLVLARVQLRKAITGDCLIFSNRHTIKFFVELMLLEGVDWRDVKARVGALGRESVEMMRELGVMPDFSVTASNADAVLGKLLSHVRGKSVFLVGGAEQGDSLLENLNREGISAERLPVFQYHERTPQPVDWDRVDEVFFAGPTAVQAFPIKYPEARVRDISAVCMGETVAQKARLMGFVAVRNIAALADHSGAGQNIGETNQRHGPCSGTEAGGLKHISTKEIGEQ
ncbi:uroporphyrinogen-III C-methyltransferase [Candidatus Sumerlaeota bacterium]|nr:uroporphyrinogen-III C-methyltransferase [Candidatus Sumerlaeota bacterium]